jgi:hypothetical protein
MSYQKTDDHQFLGRGLDDRMHDMEVGEAFATKRQTVPNKCKVAAAVIILLVVGGSLVYMLDIFNNGGAEPVIVDTRFTFDDIFLLGTRRVGHSWLPDGNLSYSTSGGDLMKLEVTSDAEYVLINRTRLAIEQNITFSRYWLSPDLSQVIVATDEQKLWRHSFSAIMIVVQLSDYSTTALMSNSPEARVTNVVWAADSSMVAFVSESDIYVRDMSDQSPEVRVTTDGSFAVLNGILSWVYEEEIFSDYSALWYVLCAMYYVLCAATCYVLRAMCYVGCAMCYVLCTCATYVICAMLNVVCAMLYVRFVLCVYVLCDYIAYTQLLFCVYAIPE